MFLRMNRNRNNLPGTAGSWRRSRTLLWSGLATGAVLVATLAVTYAQAPSSQNPGTPTYNKPILSPEANRLPDKNEQMALHEQQGKKANFEAANLERKHQIADDSARLLKLASDLKTEVDKTSKDTLSLGVIRKADEIEKLAHTVKEIMKLTMNGN